MPLRKIQLNEVILRWKKTTRALKIHEQEYGRYLTDLLERRTDAELVHFTDPVEAAAFFCLLDMTRRIAESEGCAWGPVPQRTLQFNR
ncbi:MAG TPA: hypothetical protein VLY83_04180 [Methanoregula sp.]|nr:hypothetical protein [Methanoregula sp.]